MEGGERETREDPFTKARSWLLPTVNLQKQRTWKENQRGERESFCKSKIVGTIERDMIWFLFFLILLSQYLSNPSKDMSYGTLGQNNPFESNRL